MTTEEKARYFRELADATRQKQICLIDKIVELNAEMIWYKERAEKYSMMQAKKSKRNNLN